MSSCDLAAVRLDRDDARDNVPEGVDDCWSVCLVFHQVATCLRPFLRHCLEGVQGTGKSGTFPELIQQVHVCTCPGPDLPDDKVIVCAFLEGHVP